MALAFGVLAHADAEHGREAWRMLRRLEHLASAYTAAHRVPPAQLLELVKTWGELHAHLYSGSADGSVARSIANFETTFWPRYVAVTNGVRRLAENGTIGRRTQANATINGLPDDYTPPWARPAASLDRATYARLQELRRTLTVLSAQVSHLPRTPETREVEARLDMLRRYIFDIREPR